MNLLNEGCSANPQAQNQQFSGYSSQFASMTPEQFQQHQQEQQQAFFRWQQSQVINREFQDLQRHPPSFNSEASQSLTQPQQVDSSKKGGRKKAKSKMGKNVEDGPVAAGSWLPDMLTSKWHTLNANCQKFNAAYKRAKRLGRSGENDVDVLKRAQSIYRDEHKGVAFCQEDAWGILKFHPKWDAPEQVD
uniref:Glutathione S-transferase T3-like n=1 Tax=Tanacetum cinerariifolium TaxID=118510 RepID=A0A699K9A7_TANCI|nr:glutathione S-transferase T3-like [Tanacetum cinerariifolium]